MAVKGSCPCRQTACSVCLLAASRTSMQDAEAWALRRCKDRQNFDCAREKEVFFRQTACGMGKCLYFRVVKSRQSLSNQTAGYCFLVGLCKFTFEEQSEECAFFSRAVFSTSTSSVITFSKSPPPSNPSCGSPQSASGRCQSHRGRCRRCARCGRKGSAR